MMAAARAERRIASISKYPWAENAPDAMRSAVAGRGNQKDANDTTKNSRA